MEALEEEEEMAKAREGTKRRVGRGQLGKWKPRACCVQQEVGWDAGCGTWAEFSQVP